MPDDYRQMIATYHQSIALLTSRIHELNEQIRTRKTEPGETIGLLVDRRYKLYQETWEMQSSIRMMQDYIDAVESREQQTVPA
jgi:prefoldin subunit 5